MNISYTLQSNDQLTLLLKAKGIYTWNHLTEYIRHLPYGRNSNRTDLSLVIIEQKGSCSSKHAFLKHIADLNSIPHIKLMLCIFKMNVINTPKIGNVLLENNLDFMPEAHCYLLIENQRLDFTSRNSDFKRIKNDILLEQEIEPYQVAKFKVDFHKAYIKSWIETYEIHFSFDEIWDFREVCIRNLSG